MKRSASLCLSILLLLAAVLPAAGAKIFFESNLYNGTYRASPLFYDITAEGAVITDCLKDVQGDLVLPNTLGGKALCAIGKNAFENCTEITSLTVPNSVKTVGAGAFDTKNENLIIFAAKNSAASYEAEASGLSCHLPVLPYDPTRNGEVDITDLACLAQILAGWPVSVPSVCTDIDCDKTVTIADLSLLAQYLANWDIPRLFLASDAIGATHPLSSDALPASGFGAYLSDYIHLSQTVNLANPAANARSYRLTEEYSRLFGCLRKGDYLLLCFGTSDATDGVYENLCGTSSDKNSLAYTLKVHYVEPARALGVTPILITPPKDLSSPAKSEAVANCIRTLANEEDLLCLDLYAESAALYDSLGENASLLFRRESEHSLPDFSRTNLAGAKQFAFRIAKMLTENVDAIKRREKDAPSPENDLKKFAPTETASVFTFADGTTLQTTSPVLKASDFAAHSDAPLTEVKAAEGVYLIDNATFQNQESLQKVSLPASLEKIGISAFEGCVTLSEIEFPAALSVIDASAFRNCVNLTFSALPASLSHLEQNAFENCTSLTSLDLADTALTTIAEKAFYGCAMLETLRLPRFCEHIEEEAFRNCRKLKEIVLHEGITTIGSRAFSDTALVGVLLPSTLYSMGDCVFAD
ncbi:MAG: leucine-rich repeat protein [Clostridia bacterium]|nr:leucine-rich repeat protein [Clostridia bacterium]